MREAIEDFDEIFNERARGKIKKDGGEGKTDKSK